MELLRSFAVTPGATFHHRVGLRGGIGGTDRFGLQSRSWNSATGKSELRNLAIATTLGILCIGKDDHILSSHQLLLKIRRGNTPRQMQRRAPISETLKDLSDQLESALQLGRPYAIPVSTKLARFRATGIIHLHEPRAFPKRRQIAESRSRGGHDTSRLMSLLLGGAARLHDRSNAKQQGSGLTPHVDLHSPSQQKIIKTIPAQLFASNDEL